MGDAQALLVLTDIIQTLTIGILVIIIWRNVK